MLSLKTEHSFFCAIKPRTNAFVVAFYFYRESENQWIHQSKWQVSLALQNPVDVIWFRILQLLNEISKDELPIAFE